MVGENSGGMLLQWKGLVDLLKVPIRLMLHFPFVESRLRAFYFLGGGIPRIELMSAYGAGEAWLLSQMKSGTTLVTNVVGFYNAQTLGIGNIDFDGLRKVGVSRGFGGTREAWMDNFDFMRQNKSTPMLLQTHDDVPGLTPDLLLTLSRDPWDYCVSSYFFHFVNRVGKNQIRIEKAIPRMVESWITTHKAQQSAKLRSKNVLEIRYEELMADKFTTLKKIVVALHGHCDDGMLLNSIEQASVENIKEHEAKTKKALVAPKTFTASNFVRSGKVGESKEFLTDTQYGQISTELHKHGFDSYP